MMFRLEKSYWALRGIGLLALFCVPALAAAQEPAAQQPAAQQPAAQEAEAPKPKGSGAYREVAKFTGHSGAVRAVAVSADGRHVASAGEDNTIHVIDAKTWVSFRKRAAPSSVHDIVFTRAGDLVVAGDKDEKLGGCVYLWQVKGDRVVAAWNPAESVIAIALSTNESQAAMIHADGTTLVWHLSGANAPPPTHVEPPVARTKRLAVDFLRDGNIILTGGMDGRIRQWTLADKPGLKPRLMSGKIRGAGLASVRFAPNSQIMASGHIDGIVRIWNQKTGEVLQQCTGHQGAVRTVAFTPDSKHVVSGGEDKTLRVWDVASGVLMWVVGGHTGAITDLVAPTADAIVSSSSDGTVRYWKRGEAAVGAIAETKEGGGPRFVRKRPERKAELAAPTTKELAAAAKLIREVFKDDFDKATDATRQRGLAAKLLEQGRQESNSDAERYAALDAARGLAIDAAAVPQAVEITDEIAAWFKVDAAKLLANTVDRLGTTCRTPDMRAKLCEIAIALADEAATDDRFAEADKIIKTADLAAKGARRADLTRIVRASDARIAAARTQWDSYQTALKSLATNSTDAAANLAVGKYLCFVRGQWDKGLVYLTRGSDARIKEAAARDAAGPETPDEWIEVADLWQAAAAAAMPSDQPHCAAAADYWYRKAIAELTGLKKLKVQKALEKLGPVSSDVQRR